MRYVVTAEEMRRYDTNAIDKIGIPGMVLMERAALAARERVLAACDNCFGQVRIGQRSNQANKSILILAGVGNNGGDGLALARLLAEEGFRVEVWCVGDMTKASEQWKLQYQILQAYGLTVGDEPASLEYTVIVDALFGVGLSREVTGRYRSAIECFNGLRGYKLALDVPSGISSDTGKVFGCAVQADETVTFAFAKRGLYLYPGCEYAGKIEIADIGINERSFLGCAPDMFCLDRAEEWLPSRRQSGNKGTFGKILLVAGSAGMAGAAVLCARAAFRSGAGMVKVITHESNRVIVQESVPEAMFDTYDNLPDALMWADVVVVGPGIGRSKDAGHILQTVIQTCIKPLLIDADGLFLLAANKELADTLALQKERSVVLTPHVGELAGLTGISVIELKEHLWQYGRDAAERFQAVVVAKDARTFVCCQGQPVYMNIHGNSGMATAGSGDVLAGVIAGLMGQYGRGSGEDGYVSAFRAACAGVRVHAAAGDAVSGARGEYACMAGDIVEAVADVMAEKVI